MKKKYKKVLLVVVLIAISAGVFIVITNPIRKLIDGRNSQRRADVNAILNAVYQYSIDNTGNLPGIDAIYGSVQIIGTSATGCDKHTIVCKGVTAVPACLDLISYLTPTYIVSIPKDPLSGTVAKTLYYINKDANNRITVGACSPEGDVKIEISK